MKQIFMVAFTVFAGFAASAQTAKNAGAAEQKPVIQPTAAQMSKEQAKELKQKEEAALLQKKKEAADAEAVQKAAPVKVEAIKNN